MAAALSRIYDALVHPLDEQGTQGICWTRTESKSVRAPPFVWTISLVKMSPQVSRHPQGGARAGWFGTGPSGSPDGPAEGLMCPATELVPCNSTHLKKKAGFTGCPDLAQIASFGSLLCLAKIPPTCIAHILADGPGSHALRGRVACVSVRDWRVCFAVASTACNWCKSGGFHGLGLSVRFLLRRVCVCV